MEGLGRGSRGGTDCCGLFVWRFHEAAKGELRPGVCVRLEGERVRESWIAGGGDCGRWMAWFW